MMTRVGEADCVLCTERTWSFDYGLESKENKDMSNSVKGSVLVVGGGIAGMQSALDLADSGYYVYLLEKSPAIGGAMAQLDKTFPTNDCAM
jgi:heterodisulfide reductase subunit A-like polyferredoxin